MSLQFPDISQKPEVMAIIVAALEEDLGDGDHSSLSSIASDSITTAKLLFKDHGIVAGLSIAYQILKLNDANCQISAFKHDGDIVQPGDIGFEVIGNAQALLKSERLLLNIMQRLSGIATTTHQAVKIVQGTKCKILDTRKTTPNLRLLEKWAVLVGGGSNHRFGLYDMIMLKDNHIDVAGGIRPAIQKAKAYLANKGFSLGIEVEARSIQDVELALLELPIQRIMLDNFNPELCKTAVQLISNRCETEASGGITLDNLKAYADSGVDFISLGMLTHSVKSLDISFKIK